MRLIEKLEKKNICNKDQLEEINEWYNKEYEKLYLCGFNFDSYLN